jgi:hypothetical protein
MSLFDFPRINFKGTITLNPGTANNDDYAANLQYDGQPFGLVDSKLVQPRTFGMSDADFIAWVQQIQTFDVTGKPGQTQQQIPAEWNYYGDMSSSATTSVIGVQAAPGQVLTAPDPSVPLTSLLGGSLTFAGGITDVNSEGSPPATQFFIDLLTLTAGGTTAVKGVPSKGACQWINFYRNVNLSADGGAGGYIYHVLLAGPHTTIDIPGFPPSARGIVLRYYLYRTLIPLSGQQLVEAYQQQQFNAATLEIAGTIAPLLDDEQILTGPVGRLLIENDPTIPTPPGTQNNGSNGMIALAPAVLQQRGDAVSADFSGTFPDYYQNGANPKFDFGPVSLAVTSGGKTSTIAPVPYADTAAGDACGWIFDFKLSTDIGDDATFSLVSPTLGTVLSETDYYFPSNQQAIYAEQYGPNDVFLNQGSLEPATVSVYRRGKLLAPEECPPITVWQYRSTPLQSPGDAIPIHENFKPGDPITVDTSEPGNRLFTFTIDGAPPPVSYSTFEYPPWITNAPSISLRILPNEDYSQYLDRSSGQAVGNEQLTFEVLYAKVLRVYYLLFPVMNLVFPLNSEEDVAKYAPKILERTEPSLWMTTAYMPRTRDMSQSRRELLRAWCRKVTT